MSVRLRLLSSGGGEFKKQHIDHRREISTMHEIVTLQLGQRANYLATHFWNLQVRCVLALAKIQQPYFDV